MAEKEMGKEGEWTCQKAEEGFFPKSSTARRNKDKLTLSQADVGTKMKAKHDTQRYKKSCLSGLTFFTQSEGRLRSTENCLFVTSK